MPIKLLSLLFLALIIVCVNCLSFEKYYNQINQLIQQTQQYTLPKNNEKLYRTFDSQITDYGEFDFIIVGGGSGGTVLANRLSEIAKWKILLLEAGGPENALSDLPAGNGWTARSPMNWGYYTTPQKTCCQAMENHQCFYPRGKVLGGSAAINAAIYARGNPIDYNNWERQGNPGWSYKDVLPYFKKSEHADIEDGDPGYHGYYGYLHVNYSTPPSMISTPFFRGNEELGIPELDYNGRNQYGVSSIQFSINYNRRETGGRAFIDPIRDRRNLHISLNSFVTNVLIDGDVARGVEFTKDGKTYIAKARKEVVLSAGSINTPQILMLSGIGPRRQLQRLGIDVKLDLPVGQNMEDHVMYIDMYLRTDITAQNLTLRESLERYVRAETPLTYGSGCEQIGFVDTKNHRRGAPDIEYLTVPQPGGKPGDARFFYNYKQEHLDALENVDALTDFRVLIVLLKPKSRGSVTLQSKSPLDFPLIDVNYFSDRKNEDIDTIYRGIQFILKLSKTTGLKGIKTSLVDTVTGCNEFKKYSREYWYCAIRQTASTIYHPTGTTRMGPSPKSSVVNSKLVVHGMKNLRVVDAGVMPEIVSGHPNAAVFMISEKTADVIKEDYGEGQIHNHGHYGQQQHVQYHHQYSYY